MEFEVWTEGYACTGQSAKAQYRGKFRGETFKDAVIAFRDTLSKERAAYINIEGLTDWGCRFFDNETDARKAFG